MNSILSSPWMMLGFLAQGLFGARFIVQWIKSERARRSIIPNSFWYLSVVGGVLLLAYAIHKRDAVFIVGQAAGTIVYIRNLYLIRRHEAERATP
jgi:lipid-A-disaccharide synthase-like uncharacterized protein